MIWEISKDTNIWWEECQEQEEKGIKTIYLEQRLSQRCLWIESTDFIVQEGGGKAERKNKL